MRSKVNNYIRGIYCILFCMLVMTGCSTISQVNSQSLRNATPEYAPISHGRLEYYRLGHGSPIVLVPGYARDISSWDRRFLAKLSARHELIVFNYRNIGGSVAQSKYRDSFDLSRDIQQLIQQLGLKNQPF